jgi:DNA-binding transcriptional ArsR family regulator
MGNYSAALEQNLSEVFLALGDPTRRAVVARLGAGPASVTELAAPFDMALPSFMKHLGVLERSGVVRSSKQGRVRTCELDPKVLMNAQHWLDRQRAIWTARSDRFASYAETLYAQETSRARRKSRA